MNNSIENNIQKTLDSFLEILRNMLSDMARWSFSFILFHTLYLFIKFNPKYGASIVQDTYKLCDYLFLKPGNFIFLYIIFSIFFLPFCKNISSQAFKRTPSLFLMAPFGYFASELFFHVLSIRYPWMEIE